MGSQPWTLPEDMDGWQREDFNPPPMSLRSFQRALQPKQLARSKRPVLHVDYNKPHVDLVGPPDPISNLRPIRYQRTSLPPRPPAPVPSPVSPPLEPSTNNLPVPSSSKETLPPAFLPPKHAFYTQNEFPTEGEETHERRVYRREREALDEWNHRFWTKNNLAYSEQKQAALAKLPPPSSPPTAAEEEARERCIDDFHKRWVEDGAADHKRWMIKWWSDTARLLKHWAQLHR